MPDASLNSEVIEKKYPGIVNFRLLMDYAWRKAGITFGGSWSEPNVRNLAEQVSQRTGVKFNKDDFRRLRMFGLYRGGKGHSIQDLTRETILQKIEALSQFTPYTGKQILDIARGRLMLVLPPPPKEDGEESTVFGVPYIIPHYVVSNKQLVYAIEYFQRSYGWTLEYIAEEANLTLEEMTLLANGDYFGTIATAIVRLSEVIPAPSGKRDPATLFAMAGLRTDFSNLSISA